MPSLFMILFPEGTAQKPAPDHIPTIRHIFSHTGIANRNGLKSHNRCPRYVMLLQQRMGVVSIWIYIKCIFLKIYVCLYQLSLKDLFSNYQELFIEDILSSFYLYGSHGLYGFPSRISAIRLHA